MSAEWCKGRWERLLVVVQRILLMTAKISKVSKSVCIEKMVQDMDM